jgi:hypothetical protein
MEQVRDNNSRSSKGVVYPVTDSTAESIILRQIEGIQRMSNSQYGNMTPEEEPDDYFKTFDNSVEALSLLTRSSIYSNGVTPTTTWSLLIIVCLVVAQNKENH